LPVGRASGKNYMCVKVNS